MKVVAATLLLVVALAASAMAQAPPHSMTGEWSGQGFQVNPGEDFSSWSIRLNLDPDGTARIEYPSLECGGALVPLTGAAGLEYRERITFGRGRCMDGGVVGLVERAGDLVFYWYDDEAGGLGVVATAVLKRDAPVS